jgi:hypothetical protein
MQIYEGVESMGNTLVEKIDEAARKIASEAREEDAILECKMNSGLTGC